MCACIIEQCLGLCVAYFDPSHRKCNVRKRRRHFIFQCSVFICERRILIFSVRQNRLTYDFHQHFIVSLRRPDSTCFRFCCLFLSCSVHFSSFVQSNVIVFIPAARCLKLRDKMYTKRNKFIL